VGARGDIEKYHRAVDKNKYLFCAAQMENEAVRIAPFGDSWKE
jgi:hypothetical protein